MQHINTRREPSDLTRAVLWWMLSGSFALVLATTPAVSSLFTKNMSETVIVYSDASETVVVHSDAQEYEADIAGLRFRPR